MGSTEITNLSATELSANIWSKAVSAREVMAAYLERIAVVNPKHNAIVNLADEELLLSLAAAKDDELVAALADGRTVGWMHGMPQAIKDLADVAGFATTLGSRLFGQQPAARDGLMASRMRASGCIVVGKTNVPEFGLGSHTFNEVFGTTANAYDRSKTAGGSSGGAAVALATRMLPVADGSDYMGSLRNPAAWNNVFGFRPSQGRVPSWPANDSWVAQLATEGPMGRTVADVGSLLDVQAGYDRRVPLSIADGSRFNGDLRSFSCEGVRVGWLGDLDAYLPMEPGILAVCNDGLRHLESVGCRVDPASFGYPAEKVWDAWRVWRAWLVGPKIRPLVDTPERRSLVKPEALWELEQSDRLSAEGITTASATRSAFYQHILTLFDGFDVLVLPTAQVWPFDATQRWPTSINETTMDTYHRWMEVVLYATFAGLPCMSAPVGFGRDELPMGMQIIGGPRADLFVLQVASAYEQAVGPILSTRPPE